MRFQRGGIQIKYVEIKKAINELLKKKYPSEQYKIYGKEIKEEYNTPCFFTEILDNGGAAETKNFANGSFTIKIVYFQKEKNELDQLEKVDEIKDLFGLFFCIGNRKLTISDFSHDYIGEYQDILQISIEIKYKENTKKEDVVPIAKELGIKIIQG